LNTPSVPDGSLVDPSVDPSYVVVDVSVTIWSIWAVEC
jgi:hypothetical protein